MDEPFELRRTAYDQKRIAEVPAAQPSLERPIGSHPEGSVTWTCARAETETGNSRELVHASFGDRLPRNENRTDACTGIDPLAKESDEPGLAPGSENWSSLAGDACVRSVTRNRERTILASGA